MNILDENIPESQRRLLLSWRVPVRQIGHDIGGKGMSDDRIVPFLHRLRHPTFFTRDSGFYDLARCHARYCLVYLEVGKYEAALFVRRLLRHPNFNTGVKRMGTVIRVSHRGLSVWRIHAEHAIIFKWLEQ